MAILVLAARNVDLEAILERALTAYYRVGGDGGAGAAGPRALGAWLACRACQAAGDEPQMGGGRIQGDAHQAAAGHALAAAGAQQAAGPRRSGVFAALAAGQLRVLDDFFRPVQGTGRCVVMTDLDDTLTASFGSDLDDRTVAALEGYLDAGGILVFNTGAPFDWFYARLLRPLIAGLVACHGSAARLAQVLLILSGGNQVSVFCRGGYRLVFDGQGRDKGDGVDELIRLSRAGGLIAQLDPGQMMYLGDAFGVGGIDRPVAGKVGLVVNVGSPVPDMPGQFLNLGGGFTRTVSILTAAAEALRASGRAPSPAAAEQIGEAAIWSFGQRAFPAHGRVLVRAGAGGYVHAGVTQPDGRWAPVYEVPLIPTPDGAFEAVLPPDIDAFTFFWTQAPRTPGHPGHWECEEQGGRIFQAGI